MSTPKPTYTLLPITKAQACDLGTPPIGDILLLTQLPSKLTDCDFLHPGKSIKNDNPAII